MNLLIPADIHLPMASEDDPRVGHLLGSSAIADSARVVIVGFPTDKGVRRNGGRRGAAEGPTSIREALFRLTPDAERHDEFIDLLRTTCDLGDVAVSRELEEDQSRLGQVLAPYLARGAIVVVLGGGHEASFGHFLGYINAKKRIAILNWDAHPDVRPLEEGLGHSGTPFRQALEHPSGLCGGYTAAGLNPPSVARSHLDYMAEKNCRAHFNTSISFSAVESIYAAHENDTMVSFDIDAVDQASAPGVSTPATAGLSPHIWLHAAYRAGQCSTVCSMDLVEFSPPLDVDGRTARLAARTVWEFLRGLSQRVD